MVALIGTMSPHRAVRQAQSRASSVTARERANERTCTRALARMGRKQEKIAFTELEARLIRGAR